MELCKESLLEHIDKRNNIIKRRDLDNYIKENEKEILKLFQSICKSVDYLHSEEKIIHGDLRSKNIFISQEGKFKIGDFGHATEFSKLNISINSKNLSETNQIAFTSREVFNNNLDFKVFER